MRNDGYADGGSFPPLSDISFGWNGDISSLWTFPPPSDLHWSESAAAAAAIIAPCREIAPCTQPTHPYWHLIRIFLLQVPAVASVAGPPFRIASGVKTSLRRLYHCKNLADTGIWRCTPLSGWPRLRVSSLSSRCSPALLLSRHQAAMATMTSHTSL